MPLPARAKAVFRLCYASRRPAAIRRMPSSTSTLVRYSPNAASSCSRTSMQLRLGVWCGGPQRNAQNRNPIDAHAGIQGVARGMIPGAHRLRLFALDPSAPTHAADAVPPGLNSGDGFRTDALGCVKTRAARVVGLQDL